MLSENCCLFLDSSGMDSQELAHKLVTELLGKWWQQAPSNERKYQNILWWLVLRVPFVIWLHSYRNKEPTTYDIHLNFSTIIRFMCFFQFIWLHFKGMILPPMIHLNGSMLLVDFSMDVIAGRFLWTLCVPVIWFLQ